MDSAVAFESATIPVVPLCLAPSSEYESLWAETLGAAEVCVAILDGSVDTSHPSFAGADLTLLNTAPSADVSGVAASAHGTHVASVIFGQHNGMVRGIAPRCRGLLIPVFEATESGGVLPCSQGELARAIALAVKHGANVINISGGQLEMSGQADPMLASAVQSCADNGVLLVAAAGNDGCQCLHVPAALSSVLVVGAMDATGTPMEFSNWGDKYAARGVLAPGDAVIGASLDGGITVQSGTSVAAPIVSGVAALLMSVQLKRDGRISADKVRHALLDTAIGCEEKPVEDCRRLLAGRINVAGALSQIIKGAGVEMSEQISQTNTIDSQIAACVPVPTTCEVNRAPLPRDINSNRVVAAEAPRPANGAATPAAMTSTQIAASDCGCGGGAAQKPTLVYALGQIDYDFGSEAVRDSFVQQGLQIPESAGHLEKHLKANPSDATSIIWTLEQETTPIYAIQPHGAFAMATYERIREFMMGQLNDEIGYVSIPGTVAGQVTLLNGYTIPVLTPELRGMYSWSTAALIKAVIGDEPAQKAEKVKYQKRVDELENFLQRVYHELRNVGVDASDRAINYAATNAMQADKVFERELEAARFLKSIEVERSPICRPGADCWDVKLTFFCPVERLTQALHMHRFTIDVSGLIPVTVGNIRSWHAF